MPIDFITPFPLFAYLRNQNEQTIDFHELFMIAMIGLLIHCLYAIYLF